MEVRPVDQRAARGEDSDGGWEWEEVRRFCVRFAHRYAKSPGEAEDIAQDALLRAWRRRSTLREAGSRKQWLATIVRNEAFREHARNRPDPVDTLESEYGAEDERVLATVERADLHAALGRLDERERQLVQLRYDEDLTQTAIARRLGIPEGTVKVRLHRVRAKLRREIEFV
ncbi:MAG TPA: sigma-70 family RNA polymerase sigma factor [Solirubrobacterales bacterium]|jgi:RNA polymerase sigma-70 factor (ECF subfamily)|nr:sigma-70 family RNA polymerase sigma factor [Solirubrobacterales bacterium]